MARANTSGIGSDQQPFDPEEHLSLYKFKVVTEIKDEIVDWAKVRLGLLTTVLSIAILTGSLVGIKLVVNDYVERIADAPVKAQINVLVQAGQQAKDQVEALKFQSGQVTQMSIDAQRDLLRLRAEADVLSRFVKETERTIQTAMQDLGRLTKEYDRVKEGADFYTQYFQEQSLTIKAELLQVRNDVELLGRGFGIIEKIAGDIRQREPSSEVARQFAGFGAQWREARAASEQRARVIKLRRDIKIIHYLREDAQPERHQLSKRLVEALLAQGYTAEGWVTKAGISPYRAALDVAEEFGLDPKPLLDRVIIVSSQSALDLEDLAAIAKGAGIGLPAVSRMELAPPAQAHKTKQILAGGDNGSSFKPSSIVLIAELTADAK